MEKSERIIGFDLARTYAIFGMYIVNFNIVFGNYRDTTWAGKFLSLFSGNSSTVFVILAGMGIALMTNRPHYTRLEKHALKARINKRAWFLFALGLLLYLWWPADILHFYGGYMHMAVLLLFLDKKFYLITAAVAIAIFHLLLFFIPYETGWDFETLQYTDFWTIPGFIRNTLYNGWNSIFPWLAYFTTGMYLGRLDWALPVTQKKVFMIGLALYLPISILQSIPDILTVDEDLKFFLQADYLPPFLPFVLGTLGFGLMLIAMLMFFNKRLASSKFANRLAKTGQLTLTHYISHLTLGMILFSIITGKGYAMKMNDSEAVHPLIIFSFATIYFMLSYFFSIWWTGKYKSGPFELLMRKFSG